MSTVAAGVPAVEGRARAVFTRTEVLGLTLLAVTPLFVFTTAVIAGLPLDEGAFLAIPITAAAVGAGLAWRFGTWAKAVGLLLGLGAGTMVFWLMFGLAEPSSFIDFTAGVAWVVGVLLTLFGGVAALVKHKDLRVEATRAEHIVDRTALGVVALALLVSLGLWLTARESVSADLAAGATEVAAANFQFPEAVTVANGDSVLVRNADPFFHTFTIDELGINVDLVPGTEVLVPISGPAGSYAYYCVPHSVVDDGLDREHDMTGMITIQ